MWPSRAYELGLTLLSEVPENSPPHFPKKYFLGQHGRTSYLVPQSRGICAYNRASGSGPIWNPTRAKSRSCSSDGGLVTPSRSQTLRTSDAGSASDCRTLLSKGGRRKHPSANRTGQRSFHSPGKVQGHRLAGSGVISLQYRRGSCVAFLIERARVRPDIIFLPMDGLPEGLPGCTHSF